MYAARPVGGDPVFGERAAVSGIATRAASPCGVVFLWRARRHAARNGDRFSVASAIRPAQLVVRFEGRSYCGTRGYRDWLLSAQHACDWEAKVERVTENDADRPGCKTDQLSGQVERRGAP